MSQQTITSTATAGTPNMFDYTVVDPGTDHDYLIVLTPRISDDDHPHVIVDDDLAQAQNDVLADLARQEEALDDLRYATRGEFPEVDALYDEMNQHIVDTKTTIAQTAVAQLSGIVEGNVDRAVERAEFSRYAGCTVCPCSPGVILGSRLFLGYREVNVWVRRRPAPAQVVLTDAQYALLVAAYRGYVYRAEQTMAYSIRRDGTSMPVDMLDLAVLYGHLLVDLAAPTIIAEDRQVKPIDAGICEVDARQYAV
jgi:hypothetical protein